MGFSCIRYSNYMDTNPFIINSLNIQQKSVWKIEEEKLVIDVLLIREVEQLNKKQKT